MNKEAQKKKTREEKHLELLAPPAQPAVEPLFMNLEQPSPLKIIDSIASGESTVVAEYEYTHA